MRITSGKYGGRIVRTPRGDAVRPTQDRVREALFSMLLAELPGARFLDLFAGTGAVGIEAVSRGAGDVVWVEGDRVIHSLTVQNVTDIAGAAFARNVACSDVPRWIRTAGRGAAFDIVFADPPYVQAKDGGLADLAEALKQQGVVAPGGLLIVEMPVDAPVAALPGWEILRDRTYGKTRLVIRQLAHDEPKAEA